jgi:hypothetical protein
MPAPAPHRPGPDHSTVLARLVPARRQPAGSPSLVLRKR